LGNVLKCGKEAREGSKLRQQEGFLASDLRYFSKIYALLYYIRKRFIIHSKNLSYGSYCYKISVLS
jgi:hypothetical protein